MVEIKTEEEAFFQTVERYFNMYFNLSYLGKDGFINCGYCLLNRFKLCNHCQIENSICSTDINSVYRRFNKVYYLYKGSGMKSRKLKREVRQRTLELLQLLFDYGLSKGFYKEGYLHE